MSPLDMRTVLSGYVFSNAVCALVLAVLWGQNRKRFDGLAFWLADFVLQLIGLALVALRGRVPDFFSVVVGNGCIVGGTLVLLLGLERFVARRSVLLPNLLVLAAYLAVQAYFAFVQPSLVARTINLSLALLVTCGQSAWLMLRRADTRLRHVTRGVGLLLVGFCLVSVARIALDLVWPPAGDFLQAGLTESAIVLVYQMLYLGLTFGLCLMVNHRLVDEIQRQATFLSSNPNPVLAVDRRGAVTVSNPAAAAALEKLGLPRDPGAFVPADLDAWLGQVAGGQTTEVNREVALGEAVFGEDIYWLPQFEAAYIYARDITARLHAERERQRMEAALRESEALQRTILDHTPTFVSYLDQRRSYRFVNQLYADNFGRPREALMGQPYRDVVGEAYYQATREQVDAALAGQSFSFEASIHLPVTGLRWVLVSYTPDFDAHGGVKGVFVVGFDITERREAEAEIGRLNENLERRIAERTAQLNAVNQQLEVEIMERRQVEAALRESEVKFRTLVESAPLGVYLTDVQGACHYVNRRWSEMAGLSLQEARGAGWRAGLYPEDRDRIAQAWDQMVGAQGRWGLEYRFQNGGGKLVWVFGVATTLYDSTGQITGYLGMNTDITERKQAEAALLKANAYNRSLIEASLDSLVTIGPDGKVMDVNRATEAMTGYSRAQLIGTDFSNFFTDPGRAWAGYQQAFREGAVHGYALEIRHAGGQVTPVLYNASVYRDEAGQVLGVLAAARDITERLQAEAALRQSEALHRTMAAENARLLDLSREDAATKANLLHEVNHRVKNNLAAIIGLLYLEQRYQPTGDQGAFEALVSDLTGRIQSLAVVHDLLSSGAWGPLLLTDLADRVLQAALALLPARRQVQLMVPPSPLHLTPKQANALGLILNELATNALKYACSDDATLLLSLRIGQAADEACLEFRDNGPGFPDEVLRGGRRNVGLYLVQTLTESDLVGCVALRNDGGAVVELHF